MSNQPLALITGAAQGIGYACAEALKEAGFGVLVADINADGIQQAAAELGAVSVYPVDMGESSQVNAMFDDIDATHGALTCLVNNAGIAKPNDFLETTLEDFQEVINVNVVGVFTALQRAAKSMVRDNVEGSIINMSSINAIVAIPTIPAYCASKGAVNQITKSAALALAPHNIRVNAVGPGSIDTEMMAAVNSSEQAMKTVMARTPLKRVGTVREIADVVAFLASDKASYITGETINVDGGRLGMNYTC